MDYTKDVTFDEPKKKIFLTAVRKQLKALANKLELKKNEYTLSTFKGGIAYSGQVTLSYTLGDNKVIVHVSQPILREELGIKFLVIDMKDNELLRTASAHLICLENKNLAEVHGFLKQTIEEAENNSQKIKNENVININEIINIPQLAFA